MLDSAPLEPSFFDRPVVTVARELLGCFLFNGDVGGRIVETEAYHGSEPGCHAYGRTTGRAANLYGPPGQAYVYFSYGMHTLFNVVAEGEGTGAAVLIRALEPTHGTAEMSVRRRMKKSTDLCSGPAKLTQSLAIDLKQNGLLLGGGPLKIYPGTLTTAEESSVVAAKRVGISKAVDLPWRFLLRANPHVSPAPIR